MKNDLQCTVRPTPEPIAELDRLGDQIAELSAHLDAASARLLELIREFDARGGWHNGFSSCAAWLTWRVGLEPGAAREHVRVARALGTLPLLAQALARGELSYSKVRALTRVATPEAEERLLAVGRAGTAEHVERIVLAGAGWTASPKLGRALGATGAARYMCIKTKTAWWSSADGWHRRSARCSGTRWPPPARRCISAHARRTATTFPQKRRPWRSSRRTRWLSSPQRRSTMGSIPVHPGSGTRS